QEELARLEEEKKKREEIARIQDETKRQEELKKEEERKKALLEEMKKKEEQLSFTLTEADIEKVSQYLKKNYTLTSKKIYQSQTADLIGKPEDVVIEDYPIGDITLKRIKFKIYVAAYIESPEVLEESMPPDTLYIWTPLLNYSKVKSHFPFIPVYAIKESKLYEGKIKNFRYFNVDILIHPAQDFIILLTAQKRLITSSVIKGQQKKIDPAIIPRSLRWLLYEQ
ncbi:MAG: hypothetical protein JW827_01945, partial [Spirochaetes bacterium]|nr:hypothetical protein [Spirochaetota bacterium]